MRKIIVWTPINTSGHFPHLENDPKWLARRCEIMNKYTIPSMRAQTCKDFEWWIEIREDTFPFVAGKLDLGDIPAVLIGRPPVTDHKNGANVAWDRQHGDVVERVNAPEFIEVRLNSDDLYHHRFIHHLATMDIPAGTQCVLPRNGYYWYLKERKLCKTTHASPPFYALIYDTREWLDGYRHPMPGGHRAARKLRNIDMEGRQWVWIVHEINNKIVRKGKAHAYKNPMGFKQASLDKLGEFGQ